LLVPMEDPSPKVWDGIQNSLRREGLLRPAGGPERLEPFLVQDAARGNFYRWAFATAAVLVVLALVAYQAIIRNQATGALRVSSSTTVAAPDFDDADQQLLLEVNERAPQMKQDYEKSIVSVNAYIRDAKQYASESPNDSDAQNQLMNAYEQKTVAMVPE
jgi:predicted negative regulator of RcsB-dependent stress response